MPSCCRVLRWRRPTWGTRSMPPRAGPPRPRAPASTRCAGGVLAGGVLVDRAADTCVGKPCWKPIGRPERPQGGKGYKYKDGALASDGVLKILYKVGERDARARWSSARARGCRAGSWRRCSSRRRSRCSSGAATACACRWSLRHSAQSATYFKAMRAASVRITVRLQRCDFGTIALAEARAGLLAGERSLRR